METLDQSREKERVVSVRLKLTTDILHRFRMGRRHNPTRKIFDGGSQLDAMPCLYPVFHVQENRYSGG